LLQAAISLAYRWLVYRIAGREESAGFSARLWQSEFRRNAVAVGVYLVAAGIAFVSSVAALALILAPALAYFMPNRHASAATTS
jgi:hypothetical protein